MLPRDLDIFWPSASRIRPRQMHVLVTLSVEEQRADGVQRVEPATRLVDRLADEIGGELLARRFPGSRKDNATGLPAWNPNRTTHRSARGRAASVLLALRAGELDLIHVRAVQVQPSSGLRPPARKARPPSRRTAGGGTPGTPRPAAACPNSARGPAPSRRCSPASCRSALL